MGATKDIREAVEAEIEFDPLLDDADIHVVSISGDVALNGTVSTHPHYLAAAGLIGVRHVKDDLAITG
jgi:osmotically-inducible protein OsmY